VTSPASGPPREVTFRSSARVLGVANAALSIACSAFLAVGLTFLAERRVASGIWTLLGVLGVRWALLTYLSNWSQHAGATLRARWRATLVAHLTRPQPERERARGDLALAIEQASHAPSLELLATSAVTAMAGLAVLFWAGGWLAAAITVALLAGAVPLYRRAGRRSQATALEYQGRRSLLESRQLELLHHTTELRALGAVEYGANEIAAISDSEHAIAIRAIRVALESSLVTEFLSGVSIGLVAMVVGFALLGGRITLEHALVAVLVTSEIFTHVRRYGVEFHRREDAERSLVLLAPSGGEASRASAHLVDATDVVTAASDRLFNVVLEPGQRLLVTGPSGSGKTTLLDTLLGWREPSSGTVARADVTTGHVSVESSLLSGSLRDNLTLGQRIADADVLACLSSLGLTGARFENLDTELLSDGRGISTGENVRLALARALLANPDVLFLDDIAGVLDDDGRRLVRQTIEARRSLTVIEATVDTPLIAHVDRRIELGS
jgi:ABC-type transport system involved in cytochrome bd biosynthesis fused ATPase/permease subunit